MITQRASMLSSFLHHSPSCVYRLTQSSYRLIETLNGQHLQCKYSTSSLFSTLKGSSSSNKVNPGLFIHVVSCWVDALEMLCVLSVYTYIYVCLRVAVCVWAGDWEKQGMHVRLICVFYFLHMSSCAGGCHRYQGERQKLRICRTTKLQWNACTHMCLAFALCMLAWDKVGQWATWQKENIIEWFL